MFVRKIEPLGYKIDFYDYFCELAIRSKMLEYDNSVTSNALDPDAVECILRGYVELTRGEVLKR